MIRLTLKSENHWLDLPGGARVEVRPLDMAVYQAALAEGRRATLETFPETADSPTLSGKALALRNATFSANFAVALATFGIVSWSGVVGDGGTALEVSDDAVAALMRVPAVGSAFLAQYSASAAAVVVEGNA